MRKKDKKNRPDGETPRSAFTDAEPVADPPQTAPVAEAAPAQDEADSEVDRLRAEVAEWKDKFLRAKAEQQNVARRAANELEESIRYANAGVLRALVDLADDLERTIDAAGQSDSGNAVLDGVKLMQDKLAGMLRSHHVQPIEATNQPFDPARHEALMQQPSEEHAPGTVVQQMQKGYMLRERVLRPAKVIVAAPPAEDASAE